MKLKIAAAMLAAFLLGVLAQLAGPVLAQTPGFTIPNNSIVQGHISKAGNSPALTACGTTPAIVGTDTSGTVTMGTATPTGCVITFAAPYTGVPDCVVNWQATPLASQSWTVTATAITTVQTATSSNKLNYWCSAPIGG